MEYCYKLSILGINESEIKLAKLCRVLTFNPQTLDEITDEMHKTFTGNDKESLRDEIVFMISDLVDNGLVEEKK